MDPPERLVREGWSGLLSAEGERGVRGTGWSGAKPWGQGPVQAVLWVRKEVTPCGAGMEVNG